MGIFNININANVIDENNIVGENVAIGDLVYLASNGKYYKATASTLATSSTEIRMALQDGVIDDAINLLTYGYHTYINGTTLIPGSKLYLSIVGGGVTTSIYTDPLRVVRYIGTAYDTTTILFNPDQTYIHETGTKINGVPIHSANDIAEILEFADLASFPVTGDIATIYIALDTNKTYRWTGTQYVEISASLVLGETSLTAYRGDRGKVAYDHSISPHAPASAEENVKSDWNATTGDAEILNKPDLTAADVVALTWAELVALTTRKAGDRFQLTDSTYIGYIILSGEDSFLWENANNELEKIIII